MKDAEGNPVFNAKWRGYAVSSNSRLRPCKKKDQSIKWHLKREYYTFKKSLIETFGWMRIAEGFQTIQEEFCVHIFATIPPRMDMESIEKPVMDALQAARIFRNDNYCREKHSFWNGTTADKVSTIEVFVHKKNRSVPCQLPL